MKMTHKAIARAAGYRTYTMYCTPKSQRFDNYYFWKDADEDGRNSQYEGLHYESEAEAYKACCIECGLIAEEEYL